MIELVTPWLRNKQMIRLNCLGDCSLYDSILTCLYCKYRCLNQRDKRLFADTFADELHQMDPKYTDNNALEMICYYFEVNILVVVATPTKTTVKEEHICIYNHKPFIVLEQRGDRYHPVGVKDPDCGIQVVFYTEDDEDDDYIITNLRSNQNEIDTTKVNFCEVLGS